MRAARLIITAVNEQWAMTAAQVTTGFATSVIACGCEAGVEAVLAPEETPDGRPGVSVLVFTMGPKGLEDQLIRRVGQCVMTCPTTACFDGLGETTRENRLKIGGALRYFGNGFQISKKLEGKRYWRIPVMEGEFLVEESFGMQKAIGGGNLLILGQDNAAALAAAERAVDAIRPLRDVILPFPGGIARSGSQVGSKYKFLRASTNVAYCPMLRAQVETALPESVNSVYEIVIDGLSETAIRAAMRVGIEAAAQAGVARISAGNYGGTLGQFHFHLREIMGTQIHTDTR